MITRLSLVGLSLQLAACANESDQQPSGWRTDSLIYGGDDRQDPYLVADTATRELAARSSAAVVVSQALAVDPAGTVSVKPLLAKEQFGLCDSERFGDQPSLSSCSGTLIDDDLILTSGHCMGVAGGCQNQAWIFGYGNYDGGSNVNLSTNDIRRCRRVVLHVDEDGPSGQRLDHAIIQLDRPVAANRSPAKLRRGPLSQGITVTVIGHPLGLPVKIDQSAVVLDARAERNDYVRLSSDTYEGSSGSGVFDSDGLLVAVLARGRRDFEQVSTEHCVRSRVIDAGSVEGGEEASYAALALDQLCATGWKSTRLCGSADQCGDRQCGLTEHQGACGDCSEDAANAGRPGDTCAVSKLPIGGRPVSGPTLGCMVLALAYRRRRWRKSLMRR